MTLPSTFDGWIELTEKIINEETKADDGGLADYAQKLRARAYASGYEFVEDKFGVCYLVRRGHGVVLTFPSSHTIGDVFRLLRSIGV